MLYYETNLSHPITVVCTTQLKLHSWDDTIVDETEYISPHRRVTIEMYIEIDSVVDRYFIQEQIRQTEGTDPVLQVVIINRIVVRCMVYRGIQILGCCNSHAAVVPF